MIIRNGLFLDKKSPALNWAKKSGEKHINFQVLTLIIS